MKRSSCAPWSEVLGAVMAFGAILASPASTRAQSCSSDASCAAGFECRDARCASAICEADSDCPDYMACQAQTSWVCDGDPTDAGVAGTGATGAPGGASGAGNGGAAGMGSCIEVPADSLCVPRYQLPCEVASDCGGGFDCVEGTYWECSGGGSTAGSGGTSAGGAGGGVMPGDEPDAGCAEVPSGTSSCVLQDIACMANADCPPGLECQQQTVYPPCMADDGGVVGGSGGVAGMAGTGGDPIVCPDPIVQLRCVPPMHGGGGTGGTGGMGGTGGTGGMGGTGGTDVDAGTQDPGSSGGMGGASGTGGASGMGGSAGPDDDGESDEGHHGKHHHLGRFIRRLIHGCSVSGANTSQSPTVGWWMLGVAALALRRRVRKAA